MGGGEGVHTYVHALEEGRVYIRTCFGGGEGVHTYVHALEEGRVCTYIDMYISAEELPDTWYAV